MRRFLVLTLLVLTLGAPAAAIASEEGKRPTPFWLPRAVFAGVIASEARSPTFRLGWTPILWEDRTGALLFVAEGGLAYAANDVARAGPNETATMTYLYQHSVLFGIGYKSGLGPGLHWGFQITTGPLWYGARFEELPTENRFQGSVEGRVNAGMRIGVFEYGISLGYASPYKIRDRGASTQHVGGVLAGLYVDWL